MKNALTLSAQLLTNWEKSVSFQQTFEAKRSNHVAELEGKENEVRQMFVVRVKEKEAELKDSEKEVRIDDIKLLDHVDRHISVFTPASRQVREVEERSRWRQAQVGGFTKEARRGVRRIQPTKVSARHLAHFDVGQEQKEIGVQLS